MLSPISQLLGFQGPPHGSLCNVSPYILVIMNFWWLIMHQHTCCCCSAWIFGNTIILVTLPGMLFSVLHLLNTRSGISSSRQPSLALTGLSILYTASSLLADPLCALWDQHRVPSIFIMLGPGSVSAGWTKLFHGNRWAGGLWSSVHKNFYNGRNVLWLSCSTVTTQPTYVHGYRSR